MSNRICRNKKSKTIDKVLDKMRDHDELSRLKSLAYLSAAVSEHNEIEERVEAAAASRREENEKKFEQISTPKVKSNTFETPSVYYDLPLGARLTGAEKLHAAGIRGQGIKVGIIDCGIDDKHPMLHGKIERRYWYRSFTPLRHKHFHGTHVAGTVHNMAPDAEIYDYRVFGQVGKLATQTAVSTAIFQAYREGCHILNVSFGWSYDVPEIRNILKFVSDRGVVVCAAAGNNCNNLPFANDITWPAFYFESIGVAAWYKKDGKPVAAFTKNTSQKYDFAGYGDNVISLKPGGGFKCLSGTSIACPHVTGFIACLMSKGIIQNEGAKTNEILRDKLNAYTIDIGLKGPGNKKTLGFLTYLSKDEFDEIFNGKKIAFEGKPPAKINTSEVAVQTEYELKQREIKNKGLKYWASNAKFETSVDEDSDNDLWV